MALNTIGGLLGLFMAFFLVMFIVVVVMYIYSALALMTIAKKTNTPNAWLAWIPIGNVYLMTQIAKVPGWYTAGILLGIIPILGVFLIMALFIYLWWKIAEARKRPGWYGVIIGLVPIVNLIFVGMLAWGKD